MLASQSLGLKSPLLDAVALSLLYNGWFQLGVDGCCFWIIELDA